MLFASLCHHHEYLAENLQPQSLLRNSTFFCNVPESIREFVKSPTHGTRQGKFRDLLVCLHTCYWFMKWETWTYKWITYRKFLGGYLIMLYMTVELVVLDYPQKKSWISYIVWRLTSIQVWKMWVAEKQVSPKNKLIWCFTFSTTRTHLMTRKIIVHQEKKIASFNIWEGTKRS